MARALQYAKCGFAVVPIHTIKDGVCSCSKGTKCPNPGKHPWNLNGVKGASTKRKQISEWWTAHPEANIGIACGSKSNILALDIDPRNGGNKTLRRLKETLGNLNSTVVSNTGGGGTHHVFKLPKFKVRKDSGGKIFGPGIDVASEGAIIVVPPSVHVSGKRYRWQKGASLFKNTPASLPENWRNHIKSQRSLDKPKPPEAEVIVAGARNDTLTSIAGRLHNTGIGVETLLLALLQENQRCDPPLDKEEVERIARSIGSKPSKLYEGTQGDLAERVMKLVLDRDFGGGDHLIYCPDGRFWMYNGKHWEPTQESWLRGRTLAAVQTMTDRGGTATSAIIGQVATLLKASRSVNGDLLRFIGTPLPVINCSNGELWINTNGSVELRKHEAKSYLRHCLNVAYDPTAKCPRYDKALKEIFSKAAPTYRGLDRHWNELFGYMIQHRREIATVVILKGGGDNGKTVLMQTVLRLLGDNLVSAQRIESLETQFATGSLLGKLLLLDDDVKAGIRLPDGQLKKISEAKTVTGEHKHGPQFNFTIRSLPVLLCNNVPSLADVSFGMRRRLMVIPFDRTFTEEEKDDELFTTIWSEEMSGVLNRAIKGLQRVLARGMRFKQPKAVTAAKDAWLAEANPLPAFLNESCVREPSASYLLSDFYAAYTAWSQAKGYTRTQQSGSVARNLVLLGFEMKKRNRGQTILGLKAL
ncbi:phage/plasmid primase, P4 family [Bradyrhizobium sp. 168]|uniref:phage/plasmid primase, P4 family n=1 Tax=Bradyrhizobium sp. 168 TaxID=2782639 RepID=UPI001FF8145C|nr:phage/plasmid primase, P4 family [Bradyrhizobium sp. 168]